MSSGRAVTLRGAGLSCNGQTVTDGELLVTEGADYARAQIRDLAGGAVEVPAGLSWYELSRYLNSVGRTAPVLTTSVAATVGGTLSVGGFGVGSIRSGMQVDHVERIQVTDGAGISRWCSRTEHSELFRFALGGLGTAGLIERVVLRTVPYRPRVHLHHFRHATLPELVAHTEEVAQRDDVDIFHGMLRHGTLRSSTGWMNAPSGCMGGDCRTVGTGPVMRRDRPPRPPSRKPGRVNMWIDYALPPGTLASLVELLQRRLPLDRYPLMLYFLVVRRSERATRFAFTPTGELPVSVGFGVYLDVPDDPATITAVRNLFTDLLRHCCRLGGRPYLYGVHDLDPVLAQRLYGDDLGRLRRLRAQHHLEHVNADIPIVRAAERISIS